MILCGAKHDEQFTQDDICKLHHLFYYRIDEKNAGNYRNVPVFISGTDYEFPKPQQLALLMNAFMQEIPGLKKQYHPVYFAAMVHVRLVNIHPFIN